MTDKDPVEAIANRLKDLLAESSPFAASDIDNDTQLADLGMSSLQIQIAAAQVESAFDIRFDDGELGEIWLFRDLVDTVARHRNLQRTT